MNTITTILPVLLTILLLPLLVLLLPLQCYYYHYNYYNTTCTATTTTNINTTTITSTILILQLLTVVTDVGILELLIHALALSQVLKGQLCSGALALASATAGIGIRGTHSHLADIWVLLGY